MPCAFWVPIWLTIFECPPIELMVERKMISFSWGQWMWQPLSPITYQFLQALMPVVISVLAATFRHRVTVSSCLANVLQLVWLRIATNLKLDRKGTHAHHRFSKIRIYLGPHCDLSLVFPISFRSSVGTRTRLPDHLCNLDLPSSQWETETWRRSRKVEHCPHISPVPSPDVCRQWDGNVSRPSVSPLLPGGH